MSGTAPNDLTPPVLNLSPQEKQYFGTLFSQADKESLGVVTGEIAVQFFEKTRVAPNVLGEIWQIADSENRGLLTKPGFCVALRLIGHYQAGRDMSPELAFKPGPLPKFDGIPIPPPPAQQPSSPSLGVPPAGPLQPQGTGIRIPPLTPDKIQQYSGLFERSGAQNGQLAGESAKAIFERAGLPNEVLGRIWGLSDREGKGALDQTEFIIAMHLVTSYKARALTALPNVLPPGLYEAAARRGAPAPPGSRSGTAPPTGIPRQFTGPQRAQSPLARAPYGTPQPISAQTTGGWLITPQEKAKYDQFFNGIDTSGSGFLNGEQAVRFFSDSGLPEDTLAQIWDLADIRSEGRLSRDEFAVAMYLIRQERSKPQGAASLPAFLPQALIPPSMRNQSIPTAQTTAPTFDNAANTSQLPKSAAEDLFGLDSSPTKPTPPVTAQTTGGPPAFGMSTSRDPFGGSKPSSPVPVSPPRQTFTPQPTGGSSMFKPFMPSSAFGASLAAQHTGSSNASAQPQQQRAPPPPSAMDDLLGEAPEEETKNINNDTTELANMSNQIGNLRNQMQDVQTKKETHQRDVSATNNQKRDLEQRLQQFRAAYEQEVKTVKALEEQLKTSRAETQKLQQDFAMIQGTYQDLSTQHQTVAQQLTADQQENASLKQRISQLNSEIAQIKPQVEKMRSDARQQKGMVAINKKQLATNEGERGNLHEEMATLENEASERVRQHEERERQLQEREAQLAERERLHSDKERQLQDQEHSRNIASFQPTSAIVSPALSTGAGTNPFFRNQGAPREAGTMSPGGFAAAAPSTSAFDALFGPSFSSQQPADSNAPPSTSFKAADTQNSTASGQSASSDGRPTPSATPPLSAGHDLEPPPPPESRQFTPANLPLRNLQREPSFDSSTRAAAPGSVDNRSVATGPVTSPFDEPNTFDSSPFGHGDLTTPPAQMSGPSFQDLNADPSNEAAQTSEPFQLPTPLPEAEHMPGAFPEDGVTPMTNQTTGQSQAFPATAGTTSTLAQATSHDDFDSAFAGFGEPAQDKGKEPAHDAFGPGPVSAEAQPASRGGFGDEFPAIRELAASDDSDSESEHGFDDDFSAGPSAGNGAPLEQVETERVEHVENVGHAAPLDPPSFEAATSRPEFTEDSRANTDLPAITAQVSPPTYDSSVERSLSIPNGQLPPEFGGLLPSRQDPTQSPMPHSIPQVQPETPTTATSESFHDAASRPVSYLPGTDTTSTVTAQPPAAQKSAFDDDFADFDDLAEAKEATGEDAFGTESEIRGDEFNPTFDSPRRQSAEVTPVASRAQPAFSSAGPPSFGSFDNNASSAGGHHAQQPSISTAFAQAPRESQQGNHDWDAIFSGLDTSPAIGGGEFSTTSPPSSAAAPSSSSPFPEPPKETNTLQKPALGRAITNTGEHDDPTVKRLVGMGFPRDKAVKALEDYDYNIDAAIDHLTSTA